MTKLLFIFLFFSFSFGLTTQGRSAGKYHMIMSHVTVNDVTQNDVTWQPWESSAQTM